MSIRITFIQEESDQPFAFTQYPYAAMVIVPPTPPISPSV
ncbi:hypothetical protein RKD45_004429 [Streptomyces griseus]